MLHFLILYFFQLLAGQGAARQLHTNSNQTIKTFHLGYLFSKNLYNNENTSNELLSVVKLAVQLINNKSDGWFDSETANIELVYDWRDSECSYDVAYSAVMNLSHWALAAGGRLDGVVGSDCSSARY